jgi:hypothetical protein
MQTGHSARQVGTCPDSSGKSWKFLVENRQKTILDDMSEACVLPWLFAAG